MVLAMIMTLALMVYSLGQPINFGFWILDFRLGSQMEKRSMKHRIPRWGRTDQSLNEIQNLKSKI
jgi:hypothetical protein